jgi:hypothetical protein
MNTTLWSLMVRQSYLHVVSYLLVIAVLFFALADAYLIRQLKKALRSESALLRQRRPDPSIAERMLHPLASGLGKVRDWNSSLNSPAVRREADLAEAALFAPLRARMALTRDLSTLMGLIATLLALVAAATEFAKNGRPELLIGSVGTGCAATCVAAMGCAIALWNLSRLVRLRVEIASDTERLLLAFSSREEDEEEGGEVPIRHARV